MKSHGNKRYKKTVKGAKSYKLLVGGLANILDLEDTVIRGECRTDRSYPVPMLLIVKLRILVGCGAWKKENPLDRLG
jgi:hypothetical protein